METFSKLNLLHSGMIWSQNIAPRRMSSAELSNTFLWQLKLQTIIPRFTYHVLQQKRHSLKMDFLSNKTWVRIFLGHPVLTFDVLKFVCEFC